MNPDALAERYAFAVDLVLEAGALAMSMRQALGVIEVKNPIDFCTEADRAVESLIRNRLTARFGDAVIGEEAGGASAEHVWVVDPIDGTTNYIHGTDRWCVSLAFVAGQRVEIGLIYAPSGDRLFAARRGQGAFHNGRPMRVSNMAHGTAPVIETGWSPRRPIAGYGAMIARFVDSGFEFRRDGSGALGMADVALGRNDGYVELHINSWDVLAGLLLVQEAGGFVSDFLAGAGMMTGNPIVACTPEISERLITLFGIRV
ncbi:MAG: inositol monophosphatase family protein [Acetobacteraceae bacterium]